MKGKTVLAISIFLTLLIAPLFSQETNGSSVIRRDDIVIPFDENKLKVTQDKEEEGYSVEVVEDNSLKQKITWEGDENALEYKVEIVSIDTGKSSFFTTEETFVIFSFPPGEYKFRVITYDFFGREALESEWMNFVIAKAVQPKIEQVQSEVVTKKRQKVEIPVHLEDVPEDAKIVLVNTDTNQEIAVNFDVTTDEEDENKTVVEKIVAPRLPEGNWVISVTNPGGKTTVSEEIVVERDKTLYEYKNVNIQLGGGYDFWFRNGLLIEEFTQELNMPDYSAKISWLPFTFGRNHFGFEIEGKISDLYLNNDYLAFDLVMIYANINLMYQFNIYHDRVLLGARLGSGATFVKQTVNPYGLGDEERKLGYLNAKGGLYFMVRPFTFMNIEIGGEYSVFFAPDVMMHNAAPVLNIGLSF